MSELTVLMVAEKPSIAQVLAAALCPSGEGGIQKRKGVSPSSPVYEYAGRFKGRSARFRVTATTGHVYSLDFSQECNDWNKVSPGDLFHASTVRCYDPRARIPDHLRQEAKDVDALVLWLDCDREGENICFEVIGEVFQNMRGGYHDPEAYEGCIYRAQFSSLAAVDLQQAMQDLIHPDIRQAHSVDARQEIDLRLGVAFSRLQTLYFRKHFGNQLGRKMVTYGPCQFPTLWFCVKRHCEIEAFVPVPFWRLQITATFGGADVQCHRKSGEYWVNAEATAKEQEIRTGTMACTIARARGWRSKISRPLPLNTVAMLRMASDELGLGPGDAMHFAEQLYLKGVLSYPRTETDKYPANFDLQSTVQMLASPSAPWSAQARQILDNGFTAPREDGYDAGDHPPITPVKLTTSQAQCGGEAGYVLYCAICTHFLATISPDASFDEAELLLDTAGETFVARSSRCHTRGWLDVDNRDASDEGPVDLRSYIGHEGEVLPVSAVQVSEHHTRPPGHLTESALLEFMDTHGIGTDASMAQHVSNVQKRQYVDLNESTRQMVPSALGLALAHAYALIDQGLILPSVRAQIENGCARIAKGLETKERVIRRTIRIFERKFHSFAMRIDRVPMMLAVAYAKERNTIHVAGGAAEQGLEMWRAAEQMHLLITLEGLLAEKDRVELDDNDDSDPPPAAEASRAVEQRSEAVQLVQQALEQLGFGAADQAPQPKAKAKAKPQAAPTPPPPQAPEPQAQVNPQAASAAVYAADPSRQEDKLREAIRERGGIIESSELSKLFPSLKRKEIESFGFVVIPDENGRFKVATRDQSRSQQATPDINSLGAQSGSGKQGKGKKRGKNDASKGGSSDGGKNGANKGGNSDGKSGASKKGSLESGPSHQHPQLLLQQQQQQHWQQQQHLLWQQQSWWQGQGGHGFGTYPQQQQHYSPWPQQEGHDLLRLVQGGGARMQ